MRTLLAVERADVCLLMIDANEGITAQDATIAGEAHEAGKGIIIVVNKWDEYKKENGTLEKYKKEYIINYHICHMRQLYLFRKKLVKGLISYLI